MVYDAARLAESLQETGPHGETALRVVSIGNKGGSGAVRDLIKLPGVDMALVPLPAISRAKERGFLGDQAGRIVLVALWHVAEVHLVAAAGINSLADFGGKRVAVGEEGGTDDEVADEVFRAAGLVVKPLHIELKDAAQAMARGEVDGCLLVSGKPVLGLGAFSDVQGAHLVPLDGTALFDKGFLPATFSASDYPSLVNRDVQTVGLPMALVGYNWPKGSQRRILTSAFIRAFFSRFGELRDQRGGKWREVNLAASVPGLPRYAPAADWLNSHMPLQQDHSK